MQRNKYQILPVFRCLASSFADCGAWLGIIFILQGHNVCSPVLKSRTGHSLWRDYFILFTTSDRFRCSLPAYVLCEACRERRMEVQGQFNDLGPGYLKDCFHQSLLSCALHSARAALLVLPPTKEIQLVGTQTRAFLIAILRLWNSVCLALEARLSPSLLSFQNANKVVSNWTF